MVLLVSNGEIDGTTFPTLEPPRHHYVVVLKYLVTKDLGRVVLLKNVSHCCFSR